MAARCGSLYTIFLFQAEDGIRDVAVTGVQTCALPISLDAAQIQQQPNQGTVDLQQVQLGFRDTSGTEWSARADRGELAQESGVVQLEGGVRLAGVLPDMGEPAAISTERLDRKSTRLNSSHGYNSYA